MKPVILITHKFEEDPLPFGVGKIYSIRSNYCRAVERAGGIPIISALGNAEDYAQIADGIVFTGSSCDIEPHRYGQENRKCAFCNSVLDDMEIALFEAFAKRKKPILGVCRGIQLINVALGGTLMQDVEEEVQCLTVHAEVYKKATDFHPVSAREGSLFEKLFGSNFTTNSFHHQALKDCGSGLIPTVTTEEGIIEAVEHESLPILGVQWHPERMIGDEQTDLTDMLPLLRHFISLCRK